MTAAQSEYLYGTAHEQLPPWHARIICDTKQPYLSPLYDLEPERYARGRVCLVGDAAVVVRPHSAAGATKAIEDALTLAESFSVSASIDEAMQRYGAARLPVGQHTVELSRSLGVQQVSSCPVWREMDEETFDEWWRREEMDRTYFTPDRVGGGDKWRAR